MPAKSTSVTDVTDRPLIGVTRAHARASGGDNGEPVTSVTIRHAGGAKLAIDLGTTTGSALRKGDDFITSGAISRSRTPGSGCTGGRAMIFGPAIPGYAWARTIQLGKLRTISATGSAPAPIPPHGYAQTSCGRFSQLPPHALAHPRCTTWKTVADGLTIPNCHSFKF